MKGITAAASFSSLSSTTTTQHGRNTSWSTTVSLSREKYQRAGGPRPAPPAQSGAAAAAAALAARPQSSGVQLPTGRAGRAACPRRGRGTAHGPRPAPPSPAADHRRRLPLLPRSAPPPPPAGAPRHPAPAEGRARGRAGPARPCRPHAGLLTARRAPGRPARPGPARPLPQAPGPPTPPARGPAAASAPRPGPLPAPLSPRLLRVQTGPARLPGDRVTRRTATRLRHADATSGRRQQRAPLVGSGLGAGGRRRAVARGRGETRRVATARLRPPRPAGLACDWRDR